MIVQSYARETGTVMSDLAVPVYADGRRWGALRLAFRADQPERPLLDDAKHELRR